MRVTVNLCFITLVYMIFLAYDVDLFLVVAFREKVSVGCGHFLVFFSTLQMTEDDPLAIHWPQMTSMG